MFGEKMKALTFSYDDGVEQDRRLVNILNKYGLKCTFNLNSELLGTESCLTIQNKRINHTKIKPEEVKSLYDGHEVAVHTLTHPTLTNVDDAEIIRQVNQDKINLSELCGYEVIGMAYPGSRPNYNSHVAQVIEDNCGIKYARNTVTSGDFALQRDLLEFHPSVYHMDWKQMYSLWHKFEALEPKTPKIFYIWGHSYELDIDDTWQQFEDFCKMVSNKDDIFYGTNKEVLL